MFSRDTQYTAQQIVDTIGHGGNKQPYLLRAGGRILAAHVQRAGNPEAPDRIYVGTSPVVRSLGTAAATQRARIPVFVKEPRGGQFDFHGNYEVMSMDTSPATLEAAATRSSRTDLAGVLVLRPYDGPMPGPGVMGTTGSWITEVIRSATLATQRIVAGRPNVSDAELDDFLTAIASAEGSATAPSVVGDAADPLATAEAISSLLNVDDEPIMTLAGDAVTVDLALLRKVFQVS